MTARKAARSYHHGDLRAALKKAALSLVRKKGPRGFSLNEASRLAGVTVAAPYRHFEDKDALLAEIACDGNSILEKELRAAATSATGVIEQMIEAGMAYLSFSSTHPDYFAVIFNSGIDKSKYPDIRRSAMNSFGIILSLAQQFEPVPELARTRAVSAWALVHGLASLRADGALSNAAGQPQDLENLRPLLRLFLSQPYT